MTERWRQSAQGLFIGGEERQTDETLPSPTRQAGRDRRPRGIRVEEDVADAVAAAKAAFPAWSRADRDRARREDGRRDRRHRGRPRRGCRDPVAGERQDPLRGWIDALCSRSAGTSPSCIADEVDTGKTLPVVPGIPVETTVSYQPLGVVTVIVPFNWPIAILGAVAPARAAGRQHRDRQAAALGAAGHHPRGAAHRGEAAARRAQRRHRQGREHGRPDPEHRRREGLLHRQRERRQADHGDGLEVAHPGHARAGRQRRRGVPRGRDPRRHPPRSAVRRDLRHDRADLHERQAGLRAPLPARRGRRRPQRPTREGRDRVRAG